MAMTDYIDISDPTAQGGSVVSPNFIARRQALANALLKRQFASGPFGGVAGSSAPYGGSTASSAPLASGVPQSLVKPGMPQRAIYGVGN
jgi:hypothetical protein